VTPDSIFRTACACAALAFGAWPYRNEIKYAAQRIAASAIAHSGLALRLAVIGVLFAFAFGKVPIPAFSFPTAAPTISVETPSADMQAKVSGVAASLIAASPADRAIWASVWEKAAVVVAAPEAEPVIFTDTRSLRGFTILSLDIAWRRLAGNQPGKYPGLRESVEKVMSEAIGLEVKPVTPEVRRAYVEACKAVAWAGINKG